MRAATSRALAAAVWDGPRPTDDALDERTRQASVQTVLVDAFAKGDVRIEPTGPVADGQTVDVIVSGFPPGTTATAVLCAPPESYDAAVAGCRIRLPRSPSTPPARGGPA